MPKSVLVRQERVAAAMMKVKILRLENHPMVIVPGKGGLSLISQMKKTKMSST